MGNTNFTEAQRIDRSRFLQHFDSLMKGSDFRPMAADLIREVCEKYGLSPQPISNIQEGGKTSRDRIEQKLSSAEEKVNKAWGPSYDKHFNEGQIYALKFVLALMDMETPSPASEAGMSQEDFDRQTRADIPKMSDELAAQSDIAAIEYGRDFGDGFDISSDLTEAHEAGQSWMYRKLMEAKRPTEPVPAAKGEIPEEIKDWMDQHAETDADDDATLWYNGAKACYHKMQEEIQQRDYERHAAKEMQKFQQKQIEEYRKALQEIDDKVLAYRKIHGDSPVGNHCRNIAMETLAKYLHS